MRVSWSILVPIIVFVMVVLLVVGTKVVSAHRQQVQTGSDELKGMTGEATTDLNPQGKVFVHGEYWNAESIEGEIKAGEAVEVISVDRFTLRVKKKA